MIICPSCRGQLMEAEEFEDLLDADVACAVQRQSCGDMVDSFIDDGAWMSSGADADWGGPYCECCGVTVGHGLGHHRCDCETCCAYESDCDEYPRLEEEEGS